MMECRWNNRNLQVQESGKCVFANHNQLLWEKFDVEADEQGFVYFISCHTGNVIQCNAQGHVWCVNQNRLAWEGWRLSYPDNTSILTSVQLRTVSLAATGAVVSPLLGLAAGALVPAAMSTFGTVVAGVGTFHAPLVAGGAAATLQATSAALISVKSALIGATVCGCLGSYSQQNQERKSTRSVSHIYLYIYIIKRHLLIIYIYI
jgi:hypothetical protein